MISANVSDLLRPTPDLAMLLAAADGRHLPLRSRLIFKFFFVEMLDRAASEEFSRAGATSSQSRRNVIEVVDDSAVAGGGDGSHRSGCCS